jgi:multiple sugar transport system ATP-binding protein
MNFFEGTVAGAAGAISVTFGDGQRLAVDGAELKLAPQLEHAVGRQLIVGVRPEHLEDAALVKDGPTERRLRGLVRLRELLGSEIVVHFEVEAAPVVREEVREIAADVDPSVVAELDHLRRARRTAFVGRFGVGSQAQEGAAAEIQVAAGALRFFDPGTGARLGAMPAVPASLTEPRRDDIIAPVI